MGNTASDRKNARFYGLKLSRNTDADLIERLESQESIQGYIKSLIRADIAKGEKHMNQISLDNGHSFLTASEAIAVMREQEEKYGPAFSFEKQWAYVVNAMDPEIRETVHSELAPCTDEEFLARYLELSPDDLIIG